MRIGIVQNSAVWEDPDASMEKIRAMLKPVLDRKDHVDWLIFPEMALSGFTMDVVKATAKEHHIRFFREIARIIPAYVTFGAGVDGSNRSITVDPQGGIVSSYAKAHLFSFAGEDQHFRRGALPLGFSVNEWRVIPAVCYDLRFSYLFWENAGDTDVYVIIANWPSSRVHHWRTLLQARAIENQAFVIGVNRAGTDPHFPYPGSSLVIDPSGTVICDCGPDEGFSTVSLDRSAIAETRSRFRFLADRIPPTER